MSHLIDSAPASAAISTSAESARPLMRVNGEISAEPIRQHRAIEDVLQITERRTTEFSRLFNKVVDKLPDSEKARETARELFLEFNIQRSHGPAPHRRDFYTAIIYIACKKENVHGATIEAIADATALFRTDISNAFGILAQSLKTKIIPEVDTEFIGRIVENLVSSGHINNDLGKSASDRATYIATSLTAKGSTANMNPLVVAAVSVYVAGQVIGNQELDLSSTRKGMDWATRLSFNREVINQKMIMKAATVKADEFRAAVAEILPNIVLPDGVRWISPLQMLNVFKEKRAGFVKCTIKDIAERTVAVHYNLTEEGIKRTEEEIERKQREVAQKAERFFQTLVSSHILVKLLPKEKYGVLVHLACTQSDVLVTLPDVFATIKSMDPKYEYRKSAVGKRRFKIYRIIGNRPEKTLEEFIR